MGKAKDLTKYKRLKHEKDGTFDVAVTTPSKNVYNFHDVDRKDDSNVDDNLIPCRVRHSFGLFMITNMTVVEKPAKDKKFCCSYQPKKFFELLIKFCFEKKAVSSFKVQYFDIFS